MEKRKFNKGDKVRSYDGFSGRVISIQSIEPWRSFCPHHRVRVAISDNHTLFNGGTLIEMEGAEFQFTAL